MQLSEEDVDYQKPEALTLYDYPPRVIFQMTSSENSEPCVFQLGMTGMTKDIGFQFPLRTLKHCCNIEKTRGMFAASNKFVDLGPMLYCDSICLFTFQQ